MQVRAPIIGGWRCRMQRCVDGRGAPSGPRNGNDKHGRYTDDLPDPWHCRQTSSPESRSFDLCCRNFLHAQTCQNRSTSERDRRTGRGKMIELDVYTLALSKWAVMGNPVLLFVANNSAHFAPITAAAEQCATALGDGLQQLAEERSAHLGPIATPIR